MVRTRTRSPTFKMTHPPTYANLNETNFIVEEQMISIFMMIFMLSLGIFLAYLLHAAHCRFLHESGALLILGMMLGAVIEAAADDRLIAGIKELTSFNTHMFFIVLLPPVIFDSGYNSDRQSFFGNFIPICLFAFIGTIISAVVVAGIVYFAGKASPDTIYQLSPLESLVFGSVISATDTVTVLAVFSSLGVAPFFYSIVFGESALNDAVAIVLFRTFVRLEEESARVEGDINYWEQAGIAAASFTFTFLGSACVGVLTGVLSALFFKHIPLRKKQLQGIELQYTLLFPYMSYFLAEGVLMSGIVSILFCGFAMAQYTRKNLSQRSLRYSTDTFRTLAQLSETFVFIYVGMAFFTGDQAWEQQAFGWMALGATLAARAINIVPLTWISNRFCVVGMQRQISGREAFILWFAGLRGGMAFALSLAAERDLTNEYSGRVMQCATLIFVLFSVFIMGGTLPYFTVVLGIVKEKSHDDHENHNITNDQDIDEADILEPLDPDPQIKSEENDFSVSGDHEVEVRLRGWFISSWAYLDQEFFTPFLTRDRKNKNSKKKRNQIYDEDVDDDIDVNQPQHQSASSGVSLSSSRAAVGPIKSNIDRETVLQRRRSADAIEDSKVAPVDDD